MSTATVISKTPHRAITTRFFRPVQGKGPRVCAKAPSGAYVTLKWDSQLSPFQNHERAAMALCRRLHWDGTWFAGSNGRGYVFVRAMPYYQRWTACNSVCKG